MKKLVFLISVVILVSCNKPRTKFMYKYEYTTAQSDAYSIANGYNIKNTSLSDYKEILTEEQKERERIRLRKTKTTKVLTDTLYFVGTYDELIKK